MIQCTSESNGPLKILMVMQEAGRGTRILASTPHTFNGVIQQ